MVSKSGISELEIEKKDFKLCIKAEGKRKTVDGQAVLIQQPAQTPAPQQALQQEAPVSPQKSTVEGDKAADESKYITVKSPMIGTFYRSSSPDKPPFVAIGDSIKKGDVTCIIEAMKLFNEIESEIAGKIVKVLVDDASPVEYDQPLFLVDPA